MVHKFWRIALFLVLLPSLFAGCHNSSDSPKKYHQYSLEDEKEAEVIALCLSGAITAPGSLSDRVLADLAEIRSSFGAELEQITRDDDFPLTNPAIRFAAPWVPSCIIIGFEPDVFQLVVAGQYNFWAELNELYRVSKIDLKFAFISAGVLSFKGQFHPRRLSELYAELPGVRYANPNSTGGGSSWIYPSWRAGSQLTYLFRHGWGDCPAGCIYNEYWYFISRESGETIYIGYWNPQKNPQAPDWWSDAKGNIEQYRLF